jgi:hypothetical protein
MNRNVKTVKRHITICKNAHVISDDNMTRISKNSPFCNKCGKPSFSQCPKCHEKIECGLIVYRKSWIDDDINIISSEQPSEIPSHCPNCSQPYPWKNALIKYKILNKLYFIFDYVITHIKLIPFPWK